MFLWLSVCAREFVRFCVCLFLCVCECEEEEMSGGLGIWRDVLALGERWREKV